jgi:GntR family transcriptional regulator/MocR family aminotransferase
MRRAQGVLLPPIRMSRIRRGDVYSSLRNAVLEGVLTPGEQLPSTRRAAADYGVSRGLMEEVFGQLTEEGFLERVVGRGTFVSPRVAGLVVPRKAVRAQRLPPRPSIRGRALAANAACREPEAPLPFNAGIADTSEFPWKLWARLQNRAARELGESGLNLADPRGLWNLRAAIARYLAQFRGIRCSDSQVIIFNSAQQALISLAMLLLNRGDIVWAEDPSYLGARAAFDLAGAAVAPVPVDEEGMCIHIGLRRAPRARLAYVTPSHQYPTGAALSLGRRIALLEWAAHHNSWVVEDDYDSEFRYEGQPLATLYSLDSCERVLYLGTLNKSMFVSLRLAYLVVPAELVEPLANIRTQIDGFTPAMPQMTMSLFMDEGYFSSHLRRMRAVYGAKRTALLEGLAPLAADGWTWSNNPAGVHLLVRHKNGAYVRAVAARSSLDLALLNSYRATRGRDDGLFLRFGGLDDSSLQMGLATLVEATRQASV